MAHDYLCENCGYEAEFVTEDFDCGMDGAITTPVVCAKHGLVQAETGLNYRDPDWDEGVSGSYPCPRCKRQSALWDRRTCPKCGKPRMEFHPLCGEIMWD